MRARESSKQYVGASSRSNAQPVRGTAHRPVQSLVNLGLVVVVAAWNQGIDIARPDGVFGTEDDGRATRCHRSDQKGPSGTKSPGFSIFLRVLGLAFVAFLLAWPGAVRADKDPYDPVIQT